MKFREEIFRKSEEYDRYLFVQFFIWVSLPLVIVSFVAGIIYYGGESEKSRLMMEIYSNQMQETAANYYSGIKEYYLNVVNSREYQWLLQKKDIPLDRIDNVMAVQTDLQGGRVDEYVESYYFFNYRHGWVLGKYGLYQMSSLKNSAEVQSFLQQCTQNPHEIYWLDNTTAVTNEDAMQYEYVSLMGKWLVMKSVDYQGNMEGVLLVKLNQQELEEAAGSYKALGYGKVVAYKGNILFSSDDNLSERFSKQIQNEELNTNEMHDERYEITVFPNEANGMYFILGYDTAIEQKKVVRLIGMNLLFVVLYGILVWILRLVTRNASQPFRRLKNSNEEQRSHIRMLFVSNLLKGILEEQQIEKYIRRYEIETCAGYRLFLFRAKGMSRTAEEIINDMPEEIKNLSFVMPVLFQGNVAMIVGEEDALLVEYKMAQMFQTLCAYMQEQYNVHIMAGVSSYFTELVQGGIAAREGLEALTNKTHERADDATMVVYDDYLLQTASTDTQHQDIEEQLYDAVAEGNAELAAQLLDAVFDQMTDMGLWGADRNYCIYHLMVELLAIPQRESIPLYEVFADEKRNLFDIREKVYDEKVIRQYLFQEIITPIMETLNASQQMRESDIVRKVGKLIRDSNGNITLAECAEQLSYHPSYLSRVIKKAKNIGFQDMVNTEKIKKAKYMLMTAETSVAELAEYLGYNNVQNFIRFFKNQVGVPPAKFRKGAGNEKES